jgi:two-component system alkaline phosphatase synthesis response regulator PhoP
VSRTVLVAEDEANIVESLRFLMTKAGLQVRVATDGPSALRMVRESPPDLVLLDIMLPGCDGFEVLRAIRANPHYAGVRVMMLTAKGREIDRAKALELGVDEFVTKPFSTRDVVARVRGLVGLAAE